MAAKQGVSFRTANNPNAKYRVHFIKYMRITPEHPEGEVQTKVIITRKNNEWTNEKNQSVF